MISTFRSSKKRNNSTNNASKVRSPRGVTLSFVCEAFFGPLGPGVFTCPAEVSAVPLPFSLATVDFANSGGPSSYSHVCRQDPAQGTIIIGSSTGHTRANTAMPLSVWPES
jgi:hypothetical protein